MIRLAVIGSTSNGKTYLLRDIVESFNKLGYKCKRSLSGGALYHDAYDFCQKLQGNNGAVAATPVVKSRTYNEFRSVFIDQNKRQFQIGFLDIPGEIFASDKIARFWRIISQLYSMGKYFRFDVYRRGNERSRLLRFIGPKHNCEESDEYKKIVDAYRQTGYEIEDRLWPKCRNLVSGEKVVSNFFDYDTDSVVEAIAQAVPYFTQSANITQSEFLNTEVSKELFYFFYCVYATDVVLCDKFVLPENLGKGNVTPTSESPITQLASLYAIHEFKPGKKNYYLAFRGADALIEDSLEDLTGRGMDINDIYTLIIYLLEYRLTGRNKIPLPVNHDHEDQAELLEYLGENVATYLMTYHPASYSGSNIMAALVDKYLKDRYDVLPYYNQDNPGEFCAGVDLVQVLDQRMSMSITDFMRVAGTEDDMEIFMAPHVFLTSSAIANERLNFKVTGNDPSAVTRMQPPTNLPENRACFGTLQLVMSLLLKHNISYNYNVIGLIEYYIH